MPDSKLRSSSTTPHCHSAALPRSGKPSSSITRRALMYIAIGATAVTCVVSGATYLHLKSTITQEARVQLQGYLGERLARERLVFSHAMANMEEFRAELVHALAQPAPADLDARFDRIAHVAADGTLRSPSGVDFQRDVQIFAGPQTVVDARTKQLYVTAADLTAQFGRAWHDEFQDTYITTPQNGMILYWPEVTDWWSSCKTDLDMTKEPYIAYGFKDKDPARGPMWTPLYYDKVGKLWMVSLVRPVDIDGVHVANVSHDILLNELIDRTVGVSIPGGHNAIVRGDGRLVAHPGFMQAIQDHDGDFQARDAGSVELTSVLDMVKGVTTDTMVAESSDGKNLIAVGHIPGPDWYLAVIYPTALVDGRAVGAARLVLLLSVGALMVQLLLMAIVMRREIARPLAMLTRATDTIRGGNFATRVDVIRSDEVGQLASSFNGMIQAIAERDAALAGHAADLERTVADRTAALGDRNAQMRLVLDHVQQGLLVIDPTGQLPDERAAILDSWLGTPAPDATLIDWFEARDPLFATRLALTFAEIQDDIMPLELTLAQAPRYAHIDGRTLELSIQHVSGSGAQTRLLVVISDATDALRSAQAEVEQQDLLRLFQRMRVDRAGVHGFVQEGGSLVEVAVRNDDHRVALRALHTLKGNAGIFGQELLAKTVHRLEDRAIDAGELEHEDRDELQASWQRFVAHAGALIGSGDEVGVEISPRDLDRLAEAIRRGESPVHLLGRLEALRHERVATSLGRCAEQARGVAERLGKPGLSCTVEAGDLRLPAADWSPLFGALVHAVRNAVDHGIETPERRCAAGKPAGGTIALSARILDGELQICVTDDGAGISWDAIRAKAQSLGLPHASHEDLVDVLFADGVSTKEEVTMLSGRGVGMSALRAEALALGGAIQVRSEPGRGTTIEIRCPLRSARLKSPSLAPDGFRSQLSS